MRENVRLRQILIYTLTSPKDDIFNIVFSLTTHYLEQELKVQ